MFAPLLNCLRRARELCKLACPATPDTIQGRSRSGHGYMVTRAAHRRAALATPSGRRRHESESGGAATAADKRLRESHEMRFLIYKLPTCKSISDRSQCEQFMRRSSCGSSEASGMRGG